MFKKFEILDSETNVYGRSLKEDVERFYNDIEVRNVFALFSKYKFIQNGKQISDILNLDAESATEMLECLHNIGKIQLNEHGYSKCNNDVVYRGDAHYNKEELRDLFVKKLLQLAAKYNSTSTYSDNYFVIPTNLKSATELDSKITALLMDFLTESNKLQPDEIDYILNVGVGFTLDNISEGDKK